jgi:hypothetical protein
MRQRDRGKEQKTKASALEELMALREKKGLATHKAAAKKQGRREGDEDDDDDEEVRISFLMGCFQCAVWLNLLCTCLSLRSYGCDRLQIDSLLNVYSDYNDQSCAFLMDPLIKPFELSQEV